MSIAPVMIELLSQLNEQQREAVTSGDGPLLILAGAGSGKTRVIAYRIASLIAARGIWPRNIVAVTFTNKAAEEMPNLVKNCIRDLGLDKRQLTPRSVQAAISSAKNRGDDAEVFSARAQSIDERRASIARVFQQYEERLQRNNALDFDDLLIKTVRLLRDAPEVRERYNDRFRYILVDEYQDTNSLQFGLIRLLTERQQNICVVGDPDQSIYRWRGAGIK